jgi:hypothetical protein
MSQFNLSENWPDFSKIGEAFLQIQEKMNEIMIPVIKTMADFQSKFTEVSIKLVKAFRPLAVIDKLGDAQFVYWYFFTDEFIDAILLSNNINKTLREMCVRDKFQKVNNTIDLCRTHPIIIPYSRVFSQVITSYRNKQYDLAAVGAMSVIDGVLSDISGDTTTSIFSRANAILKKVEETDSLENEEFAVLALAMTFKKTMESISTRSEFRGKEPKNLNRHWIMHGRSHRRRTQLDCIKLFNFLYGILLIEKLGKQEFGECNEKV